MYRARDPQLDRDLAIKVLLMDWGTRQDELDRFQIEAEATARLRHPNIVAVHEVGAERGRPYLAMELIEGESLKDRLRREGTLDAREAAELVAILADALEHAHQQGVLHRDLKPANVLLTQAGVPKLTDFGLARDLSAERERLTRTGEILGTPAYMPPEQANGEVHRIDQRSDVYGLGALLYHLLVGRPPYQASSPMALIAKVLRDPPTPPRAIDPNVSAELERICLRAMKRTPGTRYPSAGAMRDDLERFLRGESTMTRSHLPLALAGLGILAAVTLVLVFSGDSGEPEPSSERVKTEAMSVATKTKGAVSKTRISVGRKAPEMPEPDEDIPRGDFVLDSHMEGVREDKAESMYFMGEALRDDRPEQAVRWYYKAADKGYAKAVERLAKQLSPGSRMSRMERSVAEHREVILGLIRRLAKEGHGEACLRLGIMTRNGSGGVEQNAAEGLRLLRAGADEGSVACMAELGVALSRTNHEASRPWLERAVARDTENDQVYLLLGNALRNTDPHRALELYRRGTVHGSRDCATQLGVLYFEGQGVERDDARARSYLERNLHKEGGGEWARSMDRYYLGRLHLEGRGGLKPNLAEAIRLFEEAGVLGLPHAFTIRGRLAWEGKIVEQNDQEAVRWFEKAATNGGWAGPDREAQLFLADAHRLGRGVPKDEGQAKKWYLEAAKDEALRKRAHEGLRLLGE